MKNTFIIAKRELSERLKSRSFLLMAMLGPILVLSVLYILFTASGGEMQKINVLVSDPIETLENIIVADNDRQIEYAFINSYLEPEDFASSPDFKDYDALLVVNEKVLSNNHVFFFQKERLNPKVPLRVQRELEKRLEGLKAKEFTALTLEEFLIIKHPLSLEVRDAFNPREKSNYKLASYAGFTFGLVIIIFVFIFGMTILRSTVREKSSRIAEVLLSMVRPNELMAGKIVGIGLAAFIQFAIWFTTVALGLYVMRILFFPDMFAGATLVEQGDNFTPYNDVVRLVYEQLNFGVMILFFFLLLVLAYLFYAGFFAALGAAQGSESDGQQFLIPLIFLFLVAIWSGYYVIDNPNTELSFWLGIIPFTSPMVVMVKLGGGYGAGEIWHLLMAILLLLLSMIFTIRMAGQIFQQALLTTGYRLNLRLFLRWMFNK